MGEADMRAATHPIEAVHMHILSLFLSLSLSLSLFLSLSLLILHTHTIAATNPVEAAHEEEKPHKNHEYANRQGTAHARQ